MRKRFGLDGEIERARLYACGLGWHEVYVNGEKVSDRMMDPAPTLYNHVPGDSSHPRVSYVTHDVTDLMCAGDNAVGVWLGHGWYSGDGEEVIGRK